MNKMPLFPTFPPATVNTSLNSIVLSPFEVESVLITLSAAKESGPNGLSNRLLRELSKELSTPYYSLFNQSLRKGIVPSLYKEANVCPIPKKATYLMSPTIDPFLCLIRKTKFWKDLYLNTYIITYVITIYFLLYSLAFFLQTQLSISYHSCTTCFAKLSIQAKKYGLSSVTPAKPLTVCGFWPVC